MLASYEYLSRNTSNPDWHAASGLLPGYWEEEGDVVTESEDDWDSADRPIVVDSDSRTAIAARFPLGQAHPEFPNLRLTSRGSMTPLHGDVTALTLKYKGLALRAVSDPDVPAAITAIKKVDKLQNRERFFSGGLTGVPGFPSFTNGWPTRMIEMVPEYSVLFVATERFETPNVVAMPSPPGAPSAPAWPYSWLANPIRVFPNGWVLTNAENTAVIGANLWLTRWDFRFEHNYQAS